ncbi:MAG: cupin domain-containing protein [Gammaproteobacteria bacterium]|nr:cupin domain-containing protein [Gammaproteobacteria bacterium]
MPLPQDITPFDENLTDTVVAASDDDWIETDPGKAWIRVLWTQGETGRHAGIYRWKKGYAAPSHKHIGAVYVYVISGTLQVRDNVLEAGDFLFEPNGMIHHKTEALEDVDYLMLADGPVIGFDEDGFTGYFGWEELKRMQAAAATPAVDRDAAG